MASWRTGDVGGGLGVAGMFVSVAVSAPSGAQAPTCFGEPATIVADPGVPTVGTDGDDVIVGTAGSDVIRGGPGDDLICGLGGDDLIRGNRGRDRIKGGPGADELRGGKGADLLIGKKGRDRLLGKSGDDTIRGNKGRDQIWGGKGQDQCDGGRGLNTYASCDFPYSVAEPGWILGNPRQTLHTSFEDPADPGNYWHPWYGPANEDEGWELNLLRRYPGRSADLLTLIDTTGSGIVVDAILLTYQVSGLSVGTACEGTFPAILLNTDNTPLRAWKVTSDSREFTEIPISALTAEEVASACLRR